MRAMRWLTAMALILLCASCARPPARAQAELDALFAALEAERGIGIFLNSREIATLAGPDAPRKYVFVAGEGGEYIVRTFGELPPGTQGVRAYLLREGEQVPLAVDLDGGNVRMAVTLAAGQAYALVLAGADERMHGEVAVEIMVAAHGRCFDLPIQLTGESIRYAKSITRARDTHWFSLTAPQDGLYVLRTEHATGERLDTQGYLTDARGVTIAHSDDLLFPGDMNFCIRAWLRAGETYLVRISAFSNMTGAYRLVVAAPTGGEVLPERLTLSANALALEVDEEYALAAALTPAGAYPDIAWSSANAEVAIVSPSGRITALAAGRATIVASACGELVATCEVTVLPVPVTGLLVDELQVTMSAQTTHPLRARVLPHNASAQGIDYSSSDPAIVSVDEQGLLTAHAPGEAVILLSTREGGFEEAVPVLVGAVKPTYRALVLGEQLYVDGRTRVGATNTAQGMADMLAAQSIDGQRYAVRLQLDSTRQQVIEGIRKAFEGAREGDVSLFYINAHGNYERGVAYLELHDGSRITAAQLEGLLRPIAGTVVLIIDCCRSGGFIEQGAAQAFNADLIGTFARAERRGRSPLAGGRYKVLTSAGMDQDSYRMEFIAGQQSEASWATVFSKALCDGAGWDLIRDKVVSLKADINRDRRVTFQEAYLYARQRTTFYLQSNGVAQFAQAYPVGDQLVLFGK